MLKISHGARWVPSGLPFILQKGGHISLLCTALVEKKAFLWKGKTDKAKVSKTVSHMIFNFSLNLRVIFQSQDNCQTQCGLIPVKEQYPNLWPIGILGYLASRANTTALGLQSPQISPMQSPWHLLTTSLPTADIPNPDYLAPIYAIGGRGVSPFE